MQWKIFIFLSMACATFCNGSISHAPTRELMSRKPIRLTGGGRVAIPFEDAVSILGREDFLTAIQQSYAELLPEGEEPEFTVQKTGPGTYAYVNRTGYETSIEEVLIETVPDQRVVIALYSEGRRFFGPYQSFCRVEVVPAGEGEVDYSVTVYARPDSGMVRFFARITPVELYFRHKLKEMTGLVINVCNQMKESKSRGEHHVVASF